MNIFGFFPKKTSKKTLSKQELKHLQDSLINYLPNYYIFWKDTNGFFLGCNSAFAGLAGKNVPEDILGKTDYDFWPKEESDHFVADDKKVLQTRQPILNIEELQTHPKTGKRCILSTSKIPLENEKGEIYGVLGISYDITEKKLEEKNLQQANLKLEHAVQEARKLQDSIIDHIPNYFIFWKNADSVYLGCNEAYAHTAGVDSPADIIGKTDYQLPWSKFESDAYIADDKEVMKSCKPKLNIVEPQTLSNGKKIVLLTSKVPLINEQGEVFGILGIYSDITQQKIDEQNLLEANIKLELAYQAKSEFIRNISHDLRTPLSGILQTSRMIYEGKLPDEEIPEYSYFIWQASSKLLNLFNQVIEISKTENYEFEDQIVKFDLYQILEELEKTYQIVAKHKKIDFYIENSPEAPRFLIGKHHRLHRILMNLLGNAFKFTETGSVKLIIEKACESSEQQLLLRFSVVDTGLGIPQEKLHIIFEPFERLQPAYQGHNYLGSGLGLSLVKDYVKKMQGEIYVESKVGHGSIFSCIIPFKRSLLDNDNDVIDLEYSQEIHLKEPITSENYATPKATIPGEDIFHVLLVEDDLLTQKIGSKILSNLGYQVDSTNSGESALQMCAKKSYNLIYIDVGLPGIDGIETIRRLRANKTSPNKNTFTVGLTAHADEIISQQGLSAGMQHIIQKPLSPEKAQQVHKYITETSDNLAFDWNLWLKRVDAQENVAEMAFHILGQQFAENRKAINNAYNKTDWTLLASITHKLKGSLGYCGLPRLEKNIKDLEIAAKHRDINNLEFLFQETLISLDQAESIYRDWSKTHPQKS